VSGARKRLLFSRNVPDENLYALRAVLPDRMGQEDHILIGESDQQLTRPERQHERIWKYNWQLASSVVRCDILDSSEPAYWVLYHVA
jgi:hypothetical protein